MRRRCVHVQFAQHDVRDPLRRCALGPVELRRMRDQLRLVRQLCRRDLPLSLAVRSVRGVVRVAGERSRQLRSVRNGLSIGLRVSCRLVHELSHGLHALRRSVHRSATRRDQLRRLRDCLSERAVVPRGRVSCAACAIRRLCARQRLPCDRRVLRTPGIGLSGRRVFLLRVRSRFRLWTERRMRQLWCPGLRDVSSRMHVDGGLSRGLRLRSLRRRVARLVHPVVCRESRDVRRGALRRHDSRLPLSMLHGRGLLIREYVLGRVLQLRLGHDLRFRTRVRHDRNLRLHVECGVRRGSHVRRDHGQLHVVSASLDVADADTRIAS